MLACLWHADQSLVRGYAHLPCVLPYARLQADPCAPVLILIPGLTGGSDARCAAPTVSAMRSHH